MPKHITKYIPGDIIETLEDFDVWTKAGGWIYWHGKPKHPSILICQQYRTLRGLVELKLLRKAELNPEKEKNLPTHITYTAQIKKITFSFRDRTFIINQPKYNISIMETKETFTIGVDGKNDVEMTY